MKKYYLIIPVFIAFFRIGFSPIQADPIDDFLTHVGEKFEKASTISAKYALVSRPISRSYLKNLKEGETINRKKLHIIVDHYDKSCALNLAIARGRSSLVDKFLAVVKNVNDLELTAWGYRQPYTLAHIALDPQYPAPSHVPLENRLKIIDALGEKGADFNRLLSLVEGACPYSNPPLAAGWPSGGPVKKHKALRARALLYGAIPSQKGTSFHGIKLEEDPKLLKLTLDYFIERTKAGVTLRPIPEVMELLKKEAAKTDFDLDKLTQKMAPINAQRFKIESQLQRCTTELATFKSQGTKKAKRKASHMQLVIETLQGEFENLNRKAKKL